MAEAPLIRVDGVSFAAGGRRILHDVDLVFRPGQVAAVIGPSGCGKTTLLKCVTAAHRPTEGDVTVAGRELWPLRRQFRRKLGYVPQDDIVHRELTVDQAFRFSARLRLDAEVPGEQIERRIATVASLLGLEERRRVRIHRLSGGQRKRVNIGIELLADPDVLVLDEPASGLDPGTEEDLLKLLARLAQQGRTVLLTTHSMEYLGDVDVIILMAEGRVLFAGRLPELLGHFGVGQAGEVFKAIRQHGADYWSSRYRDSEFAARARLA